MNSFDTDTCCFCGSSYSKYNLSPLIFTTISTALFTLLKLRQHQNNKIEIPEKKISIVEWIIEQNKLNKETQTDLEGEYTIINRNVNPN
jgi:hypothetical protein